VISFLSIFNVSCMCPRLDVMENLEKNCKIFRSEQGLNGISCASIVRLKGAAESRCKTKGNGVFLYRGLV